MYSTQGLTTSPRREDILDGMRAELSAASEFTEFKVARREREGLVWKVFVNLDDSPRFGFGGLDESLEEQRHGGHLSRRTALLKCYLLFPKTSRSTCGSPLLLHLITAGRFASTRQDNLRLF